MTNDNPIHSSAPAGISRRYFLQVTAAGVVTTTALGASGLKARAAAYEKFTWISPRGTLEVLDDYPYWS
ncbi:MAG: ABC transporter substrate-binding protein, partial [Mesorhizobium sp.]